MMLTSFTAAADTLLGVYVGAQGWDMATEGSFGVDNNQTDYGFNDEAQVRLYIELEHPLPLIPNVKVAYSELETQGQEINPLQDMDFNDTQLDLSYTDYTLYYELFDNGLFSFDLGFTAKDLSGHLDNDSIDEWIPQLYASTEVGLPLTGLSVFAEGNFLSIDDHTLSDYQVGVAWAMIDNMLIDVNISAGYRVAKVELDDLDNIYSDLDFDGVFAGIEVHF